MSRHPERTQVTTNIVLQSIIENETWAGQLPDLKTTRLFLDRAVAVYHEIEESAKDGNSQSISINQADKIKAIWVPSAPGTYFQRNKNDRYKDKKWAWWADRKRTHFAIEKAREIAEIRAGREIKGNNPAELELLGEYGPVIIYNGRPDENIALAEAVRVPWLRMPKNLGYPENRVSIISPVNYPRFNNRDYNLLDQAKTLRLPYDLEINPGDEVAIVAHAAQTVRTLYVLGNQPVIPEGTLARIMALPTPSEGMPEYPIQELRGVTYYRFIQNPPAIGNKPYTYRVY